MNPIEIEENRNSNPTCSLLTAVTLICAFAIALHASVIAPPENTTKNVRRRFQLGTELRIAE